VRPSSLFLSRRSAVLELTRTLCSNHVSVKPETWAPLGLPHPKDVPNLSIEVINFLVVDRKVALLNSNNIQDRPNLEVRSSSPSLARTSWTRG